jgi:exosome complex RNA-binding protein Rrp42 (RNase PH superfamily)
MADFKENVVEWITGDKQVTVTLTQQKHISKVRKLAEKFPDEVKIDYVNKDGSIVAHLPLRAIKINLTAKRELTEDEREILAERLRLARESGKDTDDEGDIDEDE